MSNFVTKDQYTRACAVDLSLWLLEHHPDDVALQYGSVLLLADTHISVKVGYHGYINFQTGATGNNVDYLMNFLGYSYPEAVLALLDQNPDNDTDDIDHQAHHKSYTAEDKPAILHYMVSSLEYPFPQAITSLTDENLSKILTYLNEYGVSLESAIYYICGLPRHDSEIKSAQISCPPKGNTNKNLFAYLQSRSIPAHIFWIWESCIRTTIATSYLLLHKRITAKFAGPIPTQIPDAGNAANVLTIIRANTVGVHG